MLNVRSNYLVILVATYNRLHLLKQTLDSLVEGTRCSHEIIVIDGGSTDGTIDYLKSHPGVTPVFQGRLLGTARCYNQVWRQIQSKYTCWLSDDTEVVDSSLDLAANILEADPEIGIVGLKMKDTMGPWKTRTYMGFLSAARILNCNHGVLPTGLLQSVGYFNESYRSYTIDPDLTASVLCTGKKVVMTKGISVLHHREWTDERDWKEKMKSDMDGIDNRKIYRKKFKFLGLSCTTRHRITAWLGHVLGSILFLASNRNSVRLGLNRRDWDNIVNGRFIPLTDPLKNMQRPYHLVQTIPRNLLELDANPYRHLLD